jgi:molybdenum cofactor biosynthesis enzyme MoaA
MNDHLKSIGFYTLNDDRARNANIDQPLARCELILTDKCNFKCPYCRGPKHERDAFMPLAHAERVVRLWASQGLQNIRFSGGEPTLYKGLPGLVSLAKSLGINRIAISTNGSAKLEYYKDLIKRGVDDFSISLDDCTPEGIKLMSGGLDIWDRLINNIKEISKLTYVTIGMVFNEKNVHKAKESVMFAAGLGVSDIRVLSSAQFNRALNSLKDLPEDILARFPILNYRIKNFNAGRNVRGLRDSDSKKCKLVLDDMAIAGNQHFPCIIYLREGGDAVGIVSPFMRRERESWCNSRDTHKDPICKSNCLDVCIDYNNIAERGEK